MDVASRQLWTPPASAEWNGCVFLRIALDNEYRRLGVQYNICTCLALARARCDDARQPTQHADVSLSEVPVRTHNSGFPEKECSSLLVSI